MAKLKIVKTVSFGGRSFVKMSDHKNGKRSKDTYTFPASFQKEIDRKVAAVGNEVSKQTSKLMAMMKTFKKSSDRVEMCRFAIDTAKNKIKNSEMYMKKILDANMLPPPLEESDRQVSKASILNHKLQIAEFEKAIKKEKGVKA